MIEMKAPDDPGIGLTVDDCKREIGEWVLTVRLREKANKILLDEFKALAKKCAGLEADLETANRLIAEREQAE